MIEWTLEEWKKNIVEQRKLLLERAVENAVRGIGDCVRDNWPAIDERPYLAISKEPFGFYCSVIEQDEYAVYVPWSQFCSTCAGEDDPEEMRKHAGAFRELAEDLDARAAWFEGGCEGEPPSFRYGESYDVD
jgi:hypothetical protein